MQAEIFIDSSFQHYSKIVRKWTKSERQVCHALDDLKWNYPAGFCGYYIENAQCFICNSPEVNKTNSCNSWLLEERMLSSMWKRWYKSGIEVLGSNRIHPIVYATALHELIIHGIGKFHNILIIDPTNCGKNIFIKAPWTSI